MTEPQEQPAAPQGQAAQPLPWETGQGALRGLPATLYRVCIKPHQAFAAPPPSQSAWLQALAFAVVVVLVPAVVVAVSGVYTNLAPWVAQLVTLPLTALLVHLVLWALGGAGGGFLNGTFRVICYAQAPMLLTLVPMRLVFIAVNLWVLGIMILGCRDVHRTNLGRSIVANLAPVVATMLISLAVSRLGN